MTDGIGSSKPDGFHFGGLVFKQTSLLRTTRHHTDNPTSTKMSTDYHLRLEMALVCRQQLYAKSYERISMKFSGSVGGGTRNNPIDFGSYRQNADLRQCSRVK